MHKVKTSSSYKWKLNPVRMHGRILCYRSVNNRARLSLAVYNSYQNALIPLRQKPIFVINTAAPGFILWWQHDVFVGRVFVALSNVLSCSFSWDHRKKQSSSHVILVPLPVCQYVPFVPFMCLMCCLSSVYTLINCGTLMTWPLTCLWMKG